MHHCVFQCLVFYDRNWAIKTKYNHSISTYWAIVAWSSVCRNLYVKAHVTVSLWHWKKTVIVFVVFLLPALVVFLITMSLHLWIRKWLVPKYKVKFNPPWRYQLSPSEIIAIILRPKIPVLLETEAWNGSPPRGHFWSSDLLSEYQRISTHKSRLIFFCDKNQRFPEEAIPDPLLKSGLLVPGLLSRT